MWLFGSRMATTTKSGKSAGKRKSTRKKTTRKKACKITPMCSAFGKELREKGTSIAGKGLNSPCKTRARQRKKDGCLGGISKVGKTIVITVKVPKSKLK